MGRVRLSRLLMNCLSEIQEFSRVIWDEDMMYVIRQCRYQSTSSEV